MAYDSSGLLDLDGKGVPDLFLVASISLLIFLIADLGFTGFREGNLGLIVTSFLFVITLISYIALSERVVISEGYILDGALGFTIGYLILNIGNILGGFQLSLLSTATESYLSGILASGAATVIPIVNIIFAPLGETFLIFGLTAGIWQLVKRTSFADAPAWQLVFLIGTIPSIIFGGLHGARQPSFLLLAFTMNMFWTAIIVYSDLGNISSRWIPGTLGTVAGLHVGFNASNFDGGIIGFWSLMVDAFGSIYVRSAVAIIAFFVLMGLGALVRIYILSDEVF